MPHTRHSWRKCLAAAAAAGVGLGLSGCAGFWDEVTSRDFDYRSLYRKPDPLVVLRDSQDGDKRAKALRALREPKQNGGSDQEQDMVVKLLTTAVVSEKHALCRLAAIQSLGRFKDPRVVPGLVEAYYRADSFTPELATVIRCQALTALGQVGHPSAVDLLARVVREPPVEGTETEKQQTMEVRIAAARALGSFKHYQATEALLRVLQQEKDVALRDRAHESLQAVTGKKLPADYKAWEEFLHQSGADSPEIRPVAHKTFGIF